MWISHSIWRMGVILVVGFLSMALNVLLHHEIINNKYIWKWRKESDTYLTRTCRHHWSRKSLLLQLMKDIVLAESSWYFFNLHQTLSAQCDVYRRESDRCHSLSFILKYVWRENFFRRAEQNFCGHWIRLTRYARICNARSGKVGSSHCYLDRRPLHEIDEIVYEYDRKHFHRLV